MPSVRPVIALVASLALAGTFGFTHRGEPGGSSGPLQGGPLQATGQVVDGISCDSQEGSRIHIHQHLTILDHGKPLAIPPNVGQPSARRCIYWVHTHTPDGVIHIEAPKDRSFTLGNFFNVWGQPLTRSVAATAYGDKGKLLKVWVNGKAFTGDPRGIKLDAHTDIVIEAGPPFPTPPRFTTWGTL
ncbi:MAG TPA: hypothetical protein VK636_22690 [Gemmatimonadaceae bacterium]|nr:hypothetical protein [Gemmatimonadaceae bacterium]